MSAALDGVRVLDLSRLLPGPYLTQLLADLGADVIKVEAPDGGDYLRHLPPQCGDFNAVFAAINRGKRSLALDLKQEADRERFLALCAISDVVVESFRPGVLERLGVGPEVLHRRNPRLVLCRISGYGQHGADAQRAGHDLNYVARAGLLGLAAAPAVPPVQVADLVGGALLPAIQILAALRQRDRDGVGAVLDVAMIDGAWAMMVWPLARHLACGEALQPGAGFLHGGVPAYNCYPTADGALAVAALEPKFWEPLCEALGLPELRPLGVATGAEGRAVRAQLEAVFRAHPTAHWLERLAGLDCCVEPVRLPERSYLEDPALARRELVAEVEVGGQAVALPLTPLQVGADARRRQGPPALGQHSDEILALLRAR